MSASVSPERTVYVAVSALALAGAAFTGAAVGAVAVDAVGEDVYGAIGWLLRSPG
ncbi:hypothetical protein D3C83_223020 [compost metagenome]